MKKIILTAAIISAFLMSCNQTKQKKENSPTETEAVHEHQEKEIASETLAKDNLWTDEINLDSGKKWEANIETTRGVDKMLTILKSNNKNTVKDYHALASNLNETKNFVVKECTMKGASHDNLHIFLNPLIGKIDALGKVTTTDEGAKITASIEENLEGYYNYFQ